MDFIQSGENFCELNCTLLHTLKPELKVAYERQESAKIKKAAFINGKAYGHSTSYVSQRFGDFELGFHSVVFHPGDHELVRGEPALRRKYLDRLLAAQDVRYLKSLHNYQKLLAQRNAILKQSQQTGKVQRDLLLGFTEPLVEYAVYVAYRRLDYLEKVSQRLNYALSQITQKQPEIRLLYASNWVPEIDGLSLNNNNLSEPLDERHFALHRSLPSLETLEQAFWKRLKLLESQEWRTGHSLVGPHRDEWGFFLGKLPLKGHGSQGEIRSTILALKLCEIDLFQTATQHQPLLLLDDFSSELDEERRNFLLKYLLETDLQVLVTTTEESFLHQGNQNVLARGKKFTVRGGMITEAQNREQSGERRKVDDESFHGLLRR